ncbi:helix-turn-helix domain-containing protein [Geotalea uraniireducens]|uniref:Transcriptional regulator, XRE family n=1 Tax=Geotalea uraniireducens (strain Rf4) TaxID=351605 RepID=A5G3B4_GEOUR|nr:helix-turn-helix transcriptional regulator [Geotalea uraniireducens]ABQ26282.1 transcriptional regulator, XRE family [Geotalea uraniireducens Rf4]
MTRNSLSKEGLPTPAQQAVEVLGRNIRIARKRRGWSLDEMAGSMLVTRKTLSRLENGDPAVGLSVLAAALHVLNMTDDLKKVATPESDSVGMFYEKQRLPRRVGKKKTSADDLDF